MNLRADEISSLIQKQIEGFEGGIELKETGRVISVGDGIARIYGLGEAMSGELLEFPGGLAGMVLNLEEDNVGAVLLGRDLAAHRHRAFPTAREVPLDGGLERRLRFV